MRWSGSAPALAAARLAHEEGLLGLNPTSVTVPITGAEPVPAFLVPTDSDQLVIVANGSEPIQMDINPNFGAPDLEGVSFANASVAVDTAPEVNAGRLVRPAHPGRPVRRVAGRAQHGGRGGGR